MLNNYKYYIEMRHVLSESENYDIQSKWFDTKKEAKKWLFENFDFIDDDVKVWVMTAEFYEEDNYDIIKSEEVKH